MAKNVLKVSCNSKKIKIQAKLAPSLAEGGQHHKTTLFMARAKLAKSIWPSRLPNNLLFVLSDKKPIIGSEIPSQSEVMAIVMPTKKPGNPKTLVAKNITKLDTVCPIEPYPKLPMPYDSFVENVSFFFFT